VTNGIAPDDVGGIGTTRFLPGSAHNLGAVFAPPSGARSSPFSDVLDDVRGSPEVRRASGRTQSGSDEEDANSEKAAAPDRSKDSRGHADASKAQQGAAADEAVPLTIDALAALLLNGGPTAFAGAAQIDAPPPKAGAGVARGPERPEGDARGANDDAGQPTALGPTTGGTSVPFAGSPATGDAGADHTMPGSHAAGPPDSVHPVPVAAGSQSEPPPRADQRPDVAPAPPDPGIAGAVAMPTAPPAPSAGPRSPDAPQALRALASISGAGGAAGPQSGAGLGNPGADGGSIGMQNLRKTAQGNSASQDRALVAQVTKGLMAALKNSDETGGEVVLRLQPKALGELKIRVAMDGGAIGAEFHTSSRQARDLLEDSLTKLKADLENKGLIVHRLNVHLSASTERSQEHTTSSGSHGGPQENQTGQNGSDPGQHRGHEPHSGSKGTPRSTMRPVAPGSDGEAGPPTVGDAREQTWVLDTIA
jgi:hypothetical protein